MEQEIYTISVKHFPQSHTGCNIADILNDILQEWSIEKEKVHTILRDNAANMTLALSTIIFYWNNFSFFINFFCNLF